MRLFAVTFSIVIQLLLNTECFSQDGKNGPILGIGTGVGYSNHAASYRIELDTLSGSGSFKDHEGVRLLATGLRAGWVLKSIILSYYMIITPPNNTVSPYRTIDHSFRIDWDPKKFSKWSMGAGLGKIKIRDKFTGLGSGLLTELFIGFEPDSHFQIEFASIFGKIKNNIEPYFRKRELTTNNEFYIHFTVNYLWYRNAAENNE